MIFSFLYKPYPFTRSLKRELFSGFLVGCFIFLFLVLIQPFHVSEWETVNKSWKLAGFGLVSFVIPTCFNLLLILISRYTAIEDRWNLGREILSVLCVVCLITFGNMLYSNLLNTTEFNWKSYISFLAGTSLVAVFPVTIHFFLKHNRLLKKNLEKANELNSRIQETDPVKTSMQSGKEEGTGYIRLIAENGKDWLAIAADQLFYIESADNYCSIVYQENGQRKKLLLRSSLKRLETALEEQPGIIRCHRAFIVNLRAVSKVEGNAAGYRLLFDNVEGNVPVSRNYAPEVLARLKSLR